jgi:hypothetical protein
MPQRKAIVIFLIMPTRRKHRAYYSLRERYFSKNIFSDIASYVLSCEVCQKIRYRRRKDVRSGKTPAFDVMLAVNLDHFTPVTPRDQGHAYVLLMVDNAGQYLEMCAVRTTSALETARCLYEKYYMRHGFIPNLISDRAQSFLANLTQELFKIWKIRSLQTSSFHPEMNSVAEIQNNALISGLRTHLMQKRTD